MGFGHLWAQDLNDAEFDNFYDMVDTDGDGDISMDEFKARPTSLSSASLHPSFPLPHEAEVRTRDEARFAHDDVSPPRLRSQSCPVHGAPCPASLRFVHDTCAVQAHLVVAGGRVASVVDATAAAAAAGEGGGIGAACADTG